jgi:RNA polymerase sigma-70 factor (ECF subfamily)
MTTHQGTEGKMRELCSSGAHERAATLALETHGREVLRFLIARLGVERGEEAFSDFLLDFWRGLPKFEWRSSLRSWLYVLARHVASRELRRARHKHERFASPSTLSALAAQLRSATPAHLKTAVKDRFRALREQLSEADQTLLILRIDGKLSWQELARVLHDAPGEPSEAQLEAMSVRLRQRFRSAKQRLQKAAQAEGLLGTRPR